MISKKDQLKNSKNFDEKGKLYLSFCENCQLENHESYKELGVCSWCGWGCKIETKIDDKKLNN